MIHPDTEVRYINEDIGYGLFATRSIPCGTITWTLDRLDRVISVEEMQRYPELYREILYRYSFRNNRGEFVFCWDNGRFINHSFTANCWMTPYNFEIAVRDIKKGEELTNDYGLLNIIEPFEVPGATGERTVVYPDDLLRYTEVWDAGLCQVFSLVFMQRQPLSAYLEPEITDTLERIRTGEDTLRSLATWYCPQSA